MTVSDAAPIDLEISKVNVLSRRMIEEYVDWSCKIVVGDVQDLQYNELIEFVNFRVETADSCLMLIERRRIADALGLNRSLLEHYLLLMLMCRGRKLFRLQDCTSKTEGEFKRYLQEQREKLASQHAAGEALACLEVKSYPRAKRHLMYVFEGIKDEDDPTSVIPLHYFAFQEFHPETMRLKGEDYFTYYNPDEEARKAAKAYRDEAVHQYKHYLSYDAMLQCLSLNELVDPAAQARIEAHYTFLGKYLHPTHRAARELHDHSNFYAGTTTIGMDQPYSKAAVLLASLYVSYLLAGILEEIAARLESAPPKNIADPGTASLRRLTSGLSSWFSYFWFVFNEAPLYDRFNYATYHISGEDLAAYGHYSKVPSEMVPFDQHIYNHLENVLRGVAGGRCGMYRPPF
jgi:hypothetical protein